MIENAILIIFLIVILALIGTVVYMIIKAFNHHEMNPDEFLGLLTILSSQVQTELDTYNNDIFENKGAITNNNFDIYYRDLTSRVIKNISPEMIKNLTHYYTEEAVYRFIGRTVRDFLVSKINGTT